MDEVCEQALRLVGSESVHPLLTAVLSEFREWKLHRRNTRTAAKVTNWRNHSESAEESIRQKKLRNRQERKLMGWRRTGDWAEQNNKQRREDSAQIWSYSLRAQQNKFLFNIQSVCTSALPKGLPDKINLFSIIWSYFLKLFVNFNSSKIF